MKPCYPLIVGLLESYGIYGCSCAVQNIVVINFNGVIANVLSLNGNILLIIKEKSLDLCQSLTFKAYIFQDIARMFQNIADKVR